MNRYYIPEIELKKIRNNIHVLDGLDNKFEKKIVTDTVILTTDGYYKLEKDNYIKYKIVQNDHFETMYNKITIIGVNITHKKYKEQYHIPIENEQIKITRHFYSIENNKNTVMVLEFYKNKLADLYFLSNKKLRENNLFFLQDISLFAQTINI